MPAWKPYTLRATTLESHTRYSSALPPIFGLAAAELRRDMDSSPHDEDSCDARKCSNRTDDTN